MSNLGYAVPAKTAEAIRAAAAEAREKLGLGMQGRVLFTDDWLEVLLFNYVAPRYGVEIDLRSDDDLDLKGTFAAYQPQRKVLLVKESVLRQASVGDKEAHFTVFHEIGHVHMHSEHWHFRRVQANKLSAKHSDPEWQADRFAIEFAIDRKELVDRYLDDIVAAANYYKLPYYRLQGYVIEMQQRGVFEQAKMDDIQRYLDAAQSDFDF